jgi:creatinine amidohydrolase
MKIRLEDMTWPEVEQVIKEPNVIILPAGCLEQHGKHLPLSVDFRYPIHIAELAARKIIDEYNIRILVAPAIIYGETLTFRKYPGTIGLSIDTLSRVIEEIVRDFISHGFKKILIVNGHHSNIIPITIALRKLSTEYPDWGLYAIRLFSLGSDFIQKMRKSQIMAHACELETSVTMVIQPENVQFDKAVKESQSISISGKWFSADTYGAKKLIHCSRQFPQIEEDAGVMGDPTVATRGFGEKVIAAAVDDLIELLLEIVRSGDTD